MSTRSEPQFNLSGEASSSLVGHTIWRGASRGGHEAPLLCVVRSPTTSGHRLVCRQHFVREVTWIVASSAALALPMSALPLEHWQCQCRARRGTRRRRSVIDMSHGRTWPIPVSRSALAGHWAHVANTSGAIGLGCVQGIHPVRSVVCVPVHDMGLTWYEHCAIGIGERRTKQNL